MRGAQNVRSCARDLRVATYGVISESLDSYFNDIKKLMDNMWDPAKRSSEYEAIYKTVKNAAEIKDKQMSLEEKNEAVINANIKLFDAVSKYIKGKEKIRRSTDGNSRFNNAIDALAIA